MTAPRVVVPLVGAVCAVLLAEGAARLHGDVLCTDTPGAVYQSDTRTGWRFVPGASGWLGPCGGTPVPQVPFEVGAHGLAGPERSYEKPPGVLRVLLLGGNQAAGIGVRPEATLARRLEAFADPRHGPRVEVVNGGVGGFALDNDLLWFRAEGRGYAPDVVVVVLDAPGELLAISPPLIASLGQRAPLKPYFTLVDGRLSPAPAFAPVASPPSPADAGSALLRRFQLYRNLRGLPSRSGPPMEWADVATPTDEQVAQARDGSRALARALLEALRDESAAAGARLVALVTAQGGTMARISGWESRAVLREVAAELDIPTVDPAAAFSVAEAKGYQTYIPGTGRWSGHGHVIAAVELWRFLYGGGFLPGVVPATLLGGGAAPSLRELPGALGGALHEARWTLPVRFVVYGLLAVCVLWMAAPLPAAAREWLLIASSLAVVAALVGPRLALGALAFTVVFHVVVERLPRVVGVVMVALLATGLVVAGVAIRPEGVPGEDVYRVVFIALAGNFALLRLVAYAVDRARGAPRQPLRSFLLAVTYFPTVVAGPVESPHVLAARAAAAPALEDGARLRAVPGALLRVALGALELAIVVVVLNKITPEVFATGGATVGRGRLWLWVLELAASLTLALAGWSHLAIALGTLAGLRPGENFRSPWRATDVADFWRRWHVTLGRWLHDYVYLPLGGSGRHAALNVLAVFAASALWQGWAMAKVVGFRHYGPTSLGGLFLWALVNAAAVMVAQSRRDASVPGGALASLLRTGGTLLLVGLAWIPIFLPGWQTPAACLPIYLRLFFLR